jgi:hypothetical protein
MSKNLTTEVTEFDIFYCLFLRETPCYSVVKNSFRTARKKELS